MSCNCLKKLFCCCEPKKPEPEEKPEKPRPGLSRTGKGRADKGEVGVCVSGGGIRSAAFSLGALQVLQDRYGFMRGENAAEYLSAVSGGSYIAGAYTMVNCSDRIKGPDGEKGVAPGPSVSEPQGQEPFASGTGETRFVRNNVSYLLNNGGWLAGVTAFLMVILNVLMGLIFTATMGVALIGLPAVFAYTGDHLSGMDGNITHLYATAWWIRWPVFFFSVLLLIFVVGRLARFTPPLGQGPGQPAFLVWLLRMLGRILFIVVYCTATLAALSLSIGSDWAWPWPWLWETLWWKGFGILGLITAMTIGLGILGRRENVPLRGLVDTVYRAGFFVMARMVIWVALTLVALSAAGIAFRLCLPDATAVVSDDPAGLDLAVLALIVLATFFVLIAISANIPRLAFHNVYRDAIASCFGIIRTTDGAAQPWTPRDVRLSQLGPPLDGKERFPELVVCAAANVTEQGVAPVGRNVLSITMTPSQVTIPGIPNATVDTAEMERFDSMRSGKPWRPDWGPAVTLPSAIAMTGAAVSPSMGAMTQKNLRALLTALNIRLGVWLPNIGFPPVRAGMPGEGSLQRLRIGTAAAMAEATGFHSSKEKYIYVSDGGHYENLGLVELLRRRCRTIWCVDASGDRAGTARALERAIEIAKNELDVISASINTEAFALDEVTDLPGPILANTHVFGQVWYEDGSLATVVVIKAGISAATPASIRNYRTDDRKFPHHKTFNQFFTSERFDAYCSLGRDSVSRAIDTFDAEFEPEQ